MILKIAKHVTFLLHQIMQFLSGNMEFKYLILIIFLLSVHQ